MKKNKLITKITLPAPSDSISFFLAIKELSNQFWETMDINTEISGFQIQRGSKWMPGLTENELREFQNALGFNFPVSLCNFYRTMNGLDKAGINVFADNGHPFAYRPVFYSYPADLELIREYIEWIYDANQTDHEILKGIEASRIFPVFLHRFMLVDEPATPILSMYGNDIIYWVDSISKLLAIEIFGKQINNPDDFISEDNSEKIKFWLD